MVVEPLDETTSPKPAVDMLTDALLMVEDTATGESKSLKHHGL